ncbi:MAG: hypothetical protein Ctma_0609 [Catillopecten margaritatus gill symbiont]|uniref:HpcH/HpaI aldolase/citrate lyase domain-containing protein n=1 Tax=Catillopecten margaritatus gill symbiont TaxID=3083288 RepID=A0AAU6PFY3_9GAMM
MDLIYITNDISAATIAQDAGVNRIMVDLEILDKKDRQGHLNTVISNHSLKDIGCIRSILDTSQLLVRINPINKNTEEEIEEVIKQGADIIMLPMFKSKQEVVHFLELVGGRVTTCLLLETPEAVLEIDNILALKGIDEIHIGLNDLHLSTNLTFMFELLSNGTVEQLSKKIIDADVKFGFGGVARLGNENLDASLILSEHLRLNSNMVILSRDFKEKGVDMIAEIRKIRKYLDTPKNNKALMNNQHLAYKKINDIVNNIKAKSGKSR